MAEEGGSGQAAAQFDKSIPQRRYPRLIQEGEAQLLRVQAEYEHARAEHARLQTRLRLLETVLPSFDQLLQQGAAAAAVGQGRAAVSAAGALPDPAAAAAARAAPHDAAASGPADVLMEDQLLADLDLDAFLVGTADSEEDQALAGPGSTTGAGQLASIPALSASYWPSTLHPAEGGSGREARGPGVGDGSSGTASGLAGAGPSDAAVVMGRGWRTHGSEPRGRAELVQSIVQVWHQGCNQAAKLTDTQLRALRLHACKLTMLPMHAICHDCTVQANATCMLCMYHAWDGVAHSLFLLPSKCS